jgi:hypothetical protein
MIVDRRKLPNRRARRVAMGSSLEVEVGAEADASTDVVELVSLTLPPGLALDKVVKGSPLEDERSANNNNNHQGSLKVVKEKPARPTLPLKIKPTKHRELPSGSKVPLPAVGKCGLPPAILPFLRQLTASDMNGGASSDLEGPIGQQREVWTCGQNSYGELAHGDTSSRKVHTLTEFCQNKEVIFACAGTCRYSARSLSGVEGGW